MLCVELGNIDLDLKNNLNNIMISNNFETKEEAILKVKETLNSSNYLGRFII